MKYTIHTKRNRNGIVIGEDTAKIIKQYQMTGKNHKVETDDWFGNSDDVLEIIKGETADFRDNKKAENNDYKKQENEKYFEEQNKKFLEIKSKYKNRSIEEKAKDFSVAKNIFKCLKVNWDQEKETFIYNLQKEWFEKNPTKSFYTQNWIRGYAKKHQIQIHDTQESFLQTLFKMIGNYNY